MKAKSLLIWSFFLAAAILLAPQVVAQPTYWNLEQSSAESNDGQGLAAQIAGSWLGSGTFFVDFDCNGVQDAGEPGPIPFTDVQTFGAGGDRTATNPNNPNTGHGTWAKSGPRQATGRDVVFINATETAPAFIAIIPIVVDFNQRFDDATTSFGAIGYLTTQDPLDPNEIPAFCSVGQHDSFRKVSATP